TSAPPADDLRLALGPAGVGGQAAEELGEHLQLVARENLAEELADAAHMRGGGAAQFLVALVGEDRVAHARVLLGGRTADVARSLEPIEESRDPGRRQQDALGQVDAAQASAGR